MAHPDSKAAECVMLIKPDGTTYGPYKAAFSRNIIRVFGQTAEVDDGDSLKRPLCNGNAEIYTVEKATFVRGISVSLDNWKMVVRKETTPEALENVHSAANGPGNSEGIQFGDLNIPQIQSMIQSLINAIDNSGAGADAKEEAKLRLQQFLGHPVVTTVLGAAAGALAKAAGK